MKITLMASSELDNKMNILLGETLGHVLLDSGCSKTVCCLWRLLVMTKETVLNMNLPTSV